MNHDKVRYENVYYCAGGMIGNFRVYMKNGRFKRLRKGGNSKLENVFSEIDNVLRGMLGHYYLAQFYKRQIKFIIADANNESRKGFRSVSILEAPAEAADRKRRVRFE